MKSITRTTMAVGAGGAVLVGGVAAAVPAFAGNGPGPGTASIQRAGNGVGVHVPGTGISRDQTRLPAGTLTSEQRATLASMAEEEKLARDLYAVFATRYDIPVFSRVAMAETQHLDAIRTALAAYGVTDPTAGKSAGTFTSAGTQATYDRLLAQGETGLDAALRAAQEVERADITALGTALDGLTAPRLENIYTHLLDASRTHLATFSTWLER